MHRTHAHAALPAGSIAIRLLAAALAVTAFASSTHAASTVSNGGARHWVAFDPQGRSLGEVQFLLKIVRIANASTVSNKFSIFYEP
jgi:hypothetical protein